MPLSQERRQTIIDEARRRGIDEEKLLAEAERLADAQTKAGQDEGRTPNETPSEPSGAKGKPAAAELPKPLYQYHLPFVSVNEVREVWLGLPPMPGDEGKENAAAYAAKQLAAAAAPKADAAPKAAGADETDLP